MSRKNFLKSINRIRTKNPTELEIIIKHLSAELASADRANRVLSGEQLMRSQGKALFIQEFHETLSNSVRILESEMLDNTEE